MQEQGRRTAAAPRSGLDERRRRALVSLGELGQEHVLAGWDGLTDDQRERLLETVERADFRLVGSLYRDLVVEKKNRLALPSEPWEPAQPITELREAARAAGERVLRSSNPPLYGLLVVAGGSGSGLKFDHPKALFPGTPLSSTPLLEAIIRKSQAAARSYGHDRMYPIVVMVSAETEAETAEFLERHGYFGERDRIRLARQTELPMLDRRPGLEGRVVMKSPSEPALGGAGHGDAFDHTLTSDKDTVQWLRNIGLRYLQFLNVDNLLNPVADPYFVGEHVLSEEPRAHGRAHVSVALIPKTPAGRVGNIIEVTSKGRTWQESVDYGQFPEVDRRCPLGHASLQIVTVDTLPDAEPIQFTVTQKEVKAVGGWIPAWKFERSSNNKRRYGALVLREADDVFAPIKKRSEEAIHETPCSAAALQSKHWKRLIAAAGTAAGREYVLPESAVVELPWEADYLRPADLAAELERIGFPHTLAPQRGYLVASKFSGLREMPITPGAAGTPPAPGREGRRARRRDDQSPDEQRVRAVIAHFNNAFEADPDVIVRAPGRNTLIGDHQDYPPLPQDGSAHSYTVAWASRKNVLVAARRRPDRALKLYSINHHQRFTISLDDLEGLAEEAAHGNLPDVYGQELYPWALNVMALLYSAKRGRDGVRTGLPLEGCEFAMDGNIPMGAGQSSSAAFLVAMTLACNELFEWGIPRTDILTLADLARSGEHEEYSPFIQKGRCGYLDQITSLAAVQGRAVMIDHGNYHAVRTVDLSVLEDGGYTNAVVLSGLSRSLAETDYSARVEELSRLPAAMNRLLRRKDPSYEPRKHVHQFTYEEWKSVAAELEQDDPTLARRAAYVFEENARTRRLVEALARRDLPEVLSCVNGSGEAMSMKGPFQISGYNKGPASPEPFPALDALREIVLRRAGRGSAARMIGGGGAGPLCLLVRHDVFCDPAFAKAVASEWKELTGITVGLEVDPPSPGAAVLWRRPPMKVVAGSGAKRLEQYQDALGEPVYRLVDDEAGTVVEVLAFRGTVRSMTCRFGETEKAILYNPEANPAENGAAPYLGPWINRIKDGRATFRGQRVNLMQVPGVRDDGHGHALHGLMTAGWRADLRSSGVAPDGSIRLVSTIETSDYTDDAGVKGMFGPSKTTLTHRLAGRTLHVDSRVDHLPAEPPRPDHRIPVLAAVHPWFLLDRRKHEFAEVKIPSRHHRITWKKALPRLQMIPVPYLPAVPVPKSSRHNFTQGRMLGIKPYDDVYTRLEPDPARGHPVVTLRDWFRDLDIEVGVVAGFNEFTVFRPGGDIQIPGGEYNVVCLEPQISSINALGSGAPIDADVPTIGPGESFSTSMYIRVASLAETKAPSRFTARHEFPLPPKPSSRFPRLIDSGYARPLAEPGKTTTHKDALRVFFRGRWHIYGTGHEMRDLSNPPPGHRPHRRSIMFHLSAENIDGPYHEENPPVLIGDFPKGIYEAPGLVADGDTLHLFAQTTYYRLGGTIEHFVSKDGHMFHWEGTALRPIAGTHQAGIYDVDACEWGNTKALLYSGFSREGGRDDRPDPCLFLSISQAGWSGPFSNGREPILKDSDIPWHNSHDPANPFYEWGLEGAQIMRLPDGRFLILSVAFEQRPSRDYRAAQRLLFALFDKDMKLIEVSNPILPLAPGWDEYGHGSMMVDPADPNKLRLLFQARPANQDKRFRDSDTWRLFEATFDISHLNRGA